jgi:hypothetical protein
MGVGRKDEKAAVVCGRHGNRRAPPRCYFLLQAINELMRRVVLGRCQHWAMEPADRADVQAAP